MGNGWRNALLALVALTGCATPERVFTPSSERGPESLRGVEPERAARGEIVACGQRFPIDAPVVTWIDAGGYSAYSTRARFPDEVPVGSAVPAGLRYRPGRTTDAGSVTRRSSVGELAQVIDQFVLHYDVCGLSRTCFKVLHDRRELSVHFLLDLDGTLYQTLDLADTAWHARQANARSIGIEIANMGAYPPGAASPLDEWYVADAAGTRIEVPARFGDGDLRVPGFLELPPRPARPQRIRGQINGRVLEMHDLTPEQYASLEALTAGLCELFPLITPEAPRSGGPGGDAGAAVRTEVLSDAEFAAFSGVLGHFHVSANKSDPGPAFDWERFLAGVRERRAPVLRP